jgi:L-aspartate oxidase
MNLDLRQVPSHAADVLVIGGGVAGLAAALAACRAGASRVLVLCKGEATDSNTYHAQGGVAVVLRPDDSPESHAADTLRAGAGLCDEAAVRKLVTEGPEAVRELIALGAHFDHGPGDAPAVRSGSLWEIDPEDFHFTREGGHSARRVIHAHGDATGAEIARTLVQAVRAEPRIVFLEHHFVVDLLHRDDDCFGALAVDARHGHAPVKFLASATILATGGLGSLWRETTNPPGATGDGVALALRAGAALANMEFMQFHPTVLYLAGAARMLISEAVRGEGAYLLNTRGERFMQRYHEKAELAPRDVVSTAIAQEIEETRGSFVTLDLRHLDPALVRSRFPHIAATCADFGLEITRDLIPVRPAAHYAMGGVKTDLAGRTNVRRLFACGEVASTGVHGANRLASNSLLEGLVFGRTAGRAAAELAASGMPGASEDSLANAPRLPEADEEARQVRIDLHDVQQSLQATMWRRVGLFRDGEGLTRAIEDLRRWRTLLARTSPATLPSWELRNMLTVAETIARGALLRQESRGAHRRYDFPGRDDEHWRREIVQSLTDLERDSED